ncbi:peptidase family m3 [Fusarium oxysporum f. sp. phaseoli]
MLSSRGNRLWICNRCVRHTTKPPQRRWNSIASAVAQVISPSTPVDHIASSNHDDTVLRNLFDAPTGRTFPKFSLKKSQGLFKNRYLTSPGGFQQFAQKNLERAKNIVNKVLSASSVHEYRAVVRDLDRLSDLLCRVLDLADFVRMTHPDSRFQEAAANAWGMVYQYMNQLNTMTGLSDQLSQALSIPEVTKVWSEEERTVALQLKLDFMKSAVNLPKASRDRFVDLSSRISEIGSAFAQGMRPARKQITLPAYKFYGLYPGIAATLKVRQNITLPTLSSDAIGALQSVHDEETRKEIYLAQRTASRETVMYLEAMLKLRGELAELAGFESYGHMALKDRMMAKTPASVMEFLLALRNNNTPVVQAELQELVLKKRDRLNLPDVPLQAWDKDFYMEKIRVDLRSRQRQEDQLNACSREILPEEIAEVAADHDSSGPSFESPEMAANDGMETSSADGVLKQLPTIALVCDFQPSENSKEPSLLSYQSVETLFHEMGHAIHSVLARTSFQNVSGTRCATDFAELPSTLMEHFAADPTVLSLFARHWKSDRPLPYELVAERIRLTKRFEGLETENQIILAMVDQAYHASTMRDAEFDSTAVFHDIKARFAHGPRDPPNTCWQGFFGHLHSYGSTYYSYLFDRVLAERVWRVVFKAGENGGAINRENGERLKENLLKWGGGRDPWTCLADTLQDERLAPGDEKSMALVGSWGIKDDHHP